MLSSAVRAAAPLYRHRCHSRTFPSSPSLNSSRSGNTARPTAGGGGGGMEHTNPPGAGGGPAQFPRLSPVGGAAVMGSVRSQSERPAGWGGAAGSGAWRKRRGGVSGAGLGWVGLDWVELGAPGRDGAEPGYGAEPRYEFARPGYGAEPRS